jgi:uncharacterized membrane protein
LLWSVECSETLKLTAGALFYFQVNLFRFLNDLNNCSVVVGLYLFLAKATFMSDQTYLLILRILHIGFGIFWAGSVFSFVLFIAKAVKASGPDGGKFMQQLGKTGYPIAVMITAIISILAGILLIAKLSAGFEPVWFSTAYAKVVTTGGVLAIIAFIIGFTINRPAAARIMAISNAIAKAGGPPTPGQIQELTNLRNRLFTGSNIIAVLLLFAVIAMSIFRYVY